MTEAQLRERVGQIIGFDCMGPGCDYDEDTGKCIGACRERNQARLDQVMSLVREYTAN